MKPLLAAPVDDINALKDRWPLLGSPKLDGVRALVQNGRVVSRNLKPIPNHYVQHIYSGLPNGLDGELIVGDPTSPSCFRDTTSGVMSRDGQPDVIFYLFDVFTPKLKGMVFNERYQEIRNYIKTSRPKKVTLVPHARLKNAFEFHEYEESMLEKGYEGVMLRDPFGFYKFGRSTMREGYLMKVKRFADSEAKILKVIELQHNQNVAEKDNLGHTKRSSKKAGKVAGGTMGALQVMDVRTGVIFEVGAGFSAEDRKWFWENRESMKVKKSLVKYKYFPSGSKDKPRFPVFVGLRSVQDL